MKTLFDQNNTPEIFDRIEKLSHQSQGQWGKMDVAQMLAHCSAVLDLAIGISRPQREFLGLLMGRFVKHTYYNDKPWSRNLPTNYTTKIVDKRDFGTEKQKLKEQITTFRNNGQEKCTTHPHPFLGQLSTEQWGKAMYKHLDHHLGQFGV